jgi:hypothetical protein
MRTLSKLAWRHRGPLLQVARAHQGLCHAAEQAPSLGERLQLIAARLERRPIAIMPHKCNSVQDWVGRYGALTTEVEKQ